MVGDRNGIQPSLAFIVPGLSEHVAWLKKKFTGLGNPLFTMIKFLRHSQGAWNPLPGRGAQGEKGAVDRSAQNSGTSEVRSAHRFDPGPLEAWMAREVEGFAGPLRVEQFKGGQSNPTYKLITPGRDYVLRRKPPGRCCPAPMPSTANIG